MRHSRKGLLGPSLYAEDNEGEDEPDDCEKKKTNPDYYDETAEKFHVRSPFIQLCQVRLKYRRTGKIPLKKVP
jgi:hypothetical protein